MDAFKLSFETVIIGLFALPWLWVMIDLVNPDLLHSPDIKRDRSGIPAELVGIGDRPGALFAGLSAGLNDHAGVAHEFLNDKWTCWADCRPPRKKIQGPLTMYRWVDKRRTNVPRPRLPDSTSVHFSGYESLTSDGPTEFQHEESALLLRGTDDNARLNRLHEQMTVLQGATFSAFALTILCGFAWCGNFSKDPTGAGWKLFLWQEARRWAAFVVASAMVLLAGWEILIDSHHLASGDMPIAELVFRCFWAASVWYVFDLGRTAVARLKIHGLAFFCASWFTVLCYTGYGCTEKSYDQEVFSTYRALAPASSADGAQTAARPAMAATLSE